MERERIKKGERRGKDGGSAKSIKTQRGSEGNGKRRLNALEKGIRKEMDVEENENKELDKGIQEGLDVK